MRRRKYTLLLDWTLSERLKAVKERVGVSEAEQIRRGVALWLEAFDWPARPQPRGTPSGGPTDDDGDAM